MSPPKLTMDDVGRDLTAFMNEWHARGVPRLPAARVDSWSQSLGLTRAGFYDALALWLARGFDAGRLSFEFCDFAVNAAQAALVCDGEEWPELHWRVFLAFDAGEHYRSANHSDDPIADHTRPAIAKIVGHSDRSDGAAAGVRPMQGDVD